ncbi:MAG TPA: hypothetical protein PLZ68_17230 [Ferruginibacter sp.]|nr:hypothetical protein [Ferruginibacter sp.]
MVYHVFYELKQAVFNRILQASGARWTLLTRKSKEDAAQTIKYVPLLENNNENEWRQL